MKNLFLSICFFLVTFFILSTEGSCDTKIALESSAKEKLEFSLENFIPAEKAAVLEAHDPHFLEKYAPITASFFVAFLNSLVSNEEENPLRLYADSSIVTSCYQKNKYLGYEVILGKEDLLVGYLKYDPAPKQKSSLITLHLKDFISLEDMAVIQAYDPDFAKSYVPLSALFSQMLFKALQEEGILENEPLSFSLPQKNTIGETNYSENEDNLIIGYLRYSYESKKRGPEYYNQRDGARELQPPIKQKIPDSVVNPPQKRTWQGWWSEKRSAIGELGLFTVAATIAIVFPETLAFFSYPLKVICLFCGLELSGKILDILDII